jgi:hypothetical protein
MCWTASEKNHNGQSAQANRRHSGRFYRPADGHVGSDGRRLSVEGLFEPHFAFVDLLADRADGRARWQARPVLGTPSPMASKEFRGESMFTRSANLDSCTARLIFLKASKWLLMSGISAGWRGFRAPTAPAITGIPAYASVGAGRGGSGRFQPLG